MNNFWKVRMATFISTCIITYLFTGSLVSAGWLAFTLIATNTIVMWFLIK
jgi:uncharacterized membrane protein